MVGGRGGLVCCILRWFVSWPVGCMIGWLVYLVGASTSGLVGFLGLFVYWVVGRVAQFGPWAGNHHRRDHPGRNHHRHHRHHYRHFFSNHRHQVAATDLHLLRYGKYGRVRHRRPSTVDNIRTGSTVHGLGRLSLTDGLAAMPRNEAVQHCTWRVATLQVSGLMCGFPCRYRVFVDRLARELMLVVACSSDLLLSSSSC